MTKKLLFILFISFGFVAKAQIPPQDISAPISVFPNEKVSLSINSSFLLAGELLQYKTYNLDAANKGSKLSKIVYVSLRNENDSVVFSHKLKVENSIANADFFIPSTLKTGIYRLIGYTNFSRNNKQDSFFQKNIYIVNTFVKTNEVPKATETVEVNFKTIKPSIISEKKNNEDQIKITSNKTNYGFREKVMLNIEDTFGKVSDNFTLSVRKMDPIEISGTISDNASAISNGLFYIPELRGELISGVVLSNGDGVSAANKTVSLTISGKNFIFKIAKTNANGRFFFSVTEGYNTEKSIIQLNEPSEETSRYAIIMDSKYFPIGKTISSNLKLNSNIKDWLQERGLQLQVENAYFDVKKDSILNNKVNPTFYNNLGTVFLLDDYTRFPTVKETFVEVVTLAAVRGSGTNSKFIVNNEYDPNKIAKFNDIPPLVLMDGIQIINNEDLINYNAREIESIRVVAQPYRYGSKIYSGIIAVETKKGNFTPAASNSYVETINLRSTVKQKDYYNTNYSEKSSLSRIPDYRVQLFWQPNILLSSKSFKTSFFTSDVRGTYKIHLEGFTDQGSFISVEEYFNVSEKQ